MKPYKLGAREMKPDGSVVGAGDVLFGGPRVHVIAGPCAVEGRDMLLTIAGAVKAAGATALRGGAFKPSTSPYAFQGLEGEGLRYLAEAREATGLLVCTEIMDPRDLELVDRYADFIQVGARNMQNFRLLKEVGMCKKPVLLKRGIAGTIKELLMSAEYIMAGGKVFSTVVGQVWLMKIKKKNPPRIGGELLSPQGVFEPIEEAALLGAHLAAEAGAKLLKQRPLLLGDAGGDLNIDDHELVAAPVAAQLGDAFAPDAQDFAGLGARRDFKHSRTIHRGDIHFGTQCGLSDIDVQVEQDIRLPALKELVGLDIDGDVQVTGRAAVDPWLAFPGQADLRARIDAPGDGDYFAAGARSKQRPWQVWHGVAMVSPLPPQVGQVDTCTILLTIHRSLRSVPDAITGPEVERVVRLLHRELPRFGAERRRIAVCGVNPHAGEGGLFGREDQDVVAPAVARLAAGGLEVTGPLPADTAFVRAARGEFDAVVAAYHDLGLVPVKLLAFGRAVNVTLGLPFVRTSVDHGTAFDIAASGTADPGSLLDAMALAASLCPPR